MTRSTQARDAAFEHDALACLPDVARFARSLTRDASQADDLVQETFLRAYQGYASFQPGSNVRRWLFSICHHAWLRMSQRERRVELTTDGEPGELETLAAVRGHHEATAEGLVAAMSRLDVGPAIRSAIDGLAPVFRSTVQLVDVEGLSYDEASDVLGVPVGTVRSRLFRARRLLQEQLFSYARDAGVIRRASSPQTESDS
jgi:RNA polymerase sigma-70 factor (ECF subfamily)